MDNTFSVLYTILASQRGAPFVFAANVSKTETFKVGGIHKGIDDPGKRIGCNSAFQTEHHHLVSLLACNVWHIFLFFDILKIPKTTRIIERQLFKLFTMIG